MVIEKKLRIIFVRYIDKRCAIENVQKKKSVRFPKTISICIYINILVAKSVAYVQRIDCSHFAWPHYFGWNSSIAHRDNGTAERETSFKLFKIQMLTKTQHRAINSNTKIVVDSMQRCFYFFSFFFSNAFCGDSIIFRTPPRLPYLAW